MKPEPIWKRWMKSPKKREKLFTIYWVSMIVIQLMLVAGFIMFIYLLWKRHG